MPTLQSVLIFFNFCPSVLKCSSTVLSGYLIYLSLSLVAIFVFLNLAKICDTVPLIVIWECCGGGGAYNAQLRFENSLVLQKNNSICCNI